MVFCRAWPVSACGIFIFVRSRHNAPSHRELHVNQMKKRKFKEPKFLLETMEQFVDHEEKLRDSRYRRFMVSISFPSLLLNFFFVS